MTIETNASQVSAGREPDVGECRFCGSSPAVQVTQQSVGGFAIFLRVTTTQGWMCRSCAETVHADADARTMSRAWWGIAAVTFWILLLGNSTRMRKARLLDMPRATPGVAAPLDRPMAPGLVWYRRRGPLVATCVGGALWLLIAAAVVSAIVSPA